MEFRPHNRIVIILLWEKQGRNMGMGLLARGAEPRVGSRPGRGDFEAFAAADFEPQGDPVSHRLPTQITY